MKQLSEATPGSDTVEGRVWEVDARRRVCTVQLLHGEALVSEVAFSSGYSSIRGGAYQGPIPERGDMVYLERTKGSSTYFVCGYKSLPRLPSPDEQSLLEEGDNPRADFAHDRDSAVEGDQGTWGAAGNRLTVRRSGLVESYASSLAQTRWSRADRSVRTFAFQHVVEGPFGGSAFFTQRDAALEARGRTPTGKSEWIKATAEGPEVVNVELGAVPGEEALNLPGKPRHAGAADNAVAARLLVFDPALAARYAAMRQRPDPAQAVTAMRLDMSGNASVLLAGQLTEALGARHVSTLGHHTVRAGGKMQQAAGEGWEVTARSKASISADRGIDITTGGDVRIQCERFLVEETNGDRRVRGQYRVRSGGPMQHRSAGAMTLTSGQTLSLASLSGRNDATAGRHTTTVAGGGPANFGRDVSAYAVQVLQGAMRFNALSGSYEVVLGPQEAPLARILIRADKRDPATLGRIEVGFPLSNSGMTISPDGSWQILNPSQAGIRADTAGRIQIGTVSPVVGNVLSTLSQPTCYVTGLPFKGHADVVVGASPIAPLIGAPSAGVVPPALVLPPEVAID